METRVPIWGEYPSWGPIMVRLGGGKYELEYPFSGSKEMPASEAETAIDFFKKSRRSVNPFLFFMVVYFN
jgi:hypothetical protein